MEISPDRSNARGATWDGRGTQFALWSPRATAVELCLFEPGAACEHTRIALPRGRDGVWCGYVRGIAPGQLYGYRVHGPYAPERGARFNPAKLLLDPYARALDRAPRWHDALFGGGDGADTRDARDSAEVAPRSIVIDDTFDWQGDAAPAVDLRDSVIYECHVKGMTALHPEVAPELRGTYLGLSSEPVIAHLRALGVTALELLPVQQSYTERFLVERGLINYWGYNTIGFFAPDVRFAASRAPGAPVAEFKTMVRALHRAGIEVILDVVYNHTGEADALGPTLCFRGLDNAAYYQLDPADSRRYLDFTGCGNTVAAMHPEVLRLIADSLRYWVQEMHVDGFRFDLAPALARRGLREPELDQGLFAVLHQDPVLRGVKLFAEPWDCGPGGMRLGGFLPGQLEWNSRYRDTVRRFFRGDPGQAGELATRIAGSSDLFARAGRAPQASVNFVACHDGFTLHDLTRYERKHNQRNGWNDRDGDDHNHSRNYGVEGESDDPAIGAVRARAARSMLGTWALSLGLPMLQQGDEMGRTQLGNNNAYNQDDATSWVDWHLDEARRELLGFVQRCLALRRELGVFRRTEHFRGAAEGELAPADVRWLGTDGRELAPSDWHDAERRALAMLVAGHDREGRPDESEPSTLLLVNGGEANAAFALPGAPSGWRVRLDSADPSGAVTVVHDRLIVAGHGLCVLQAPPAPAERDRS